MAAAAAPGLPELDRSALQPLGPEHHPLMERLNSATPEGIAELPAAAERYLEHLKDLRGRPWSLATVCKQDGKESGYCQLSVGQFKNLAAYVVGLFVDPGRAGPVLSLYIRQAFWSHPLHRLYTHVPITPDTTPYRRLYEQAGFIPEGTLIGHALVGGEERDVAVLGLLREDFDAWCQAHDPRLAL